VKIVAQIVAYLAFSLIVVTFSAGPELRLLADDEAVISLSFTHASQRLGECTRLTQEQLNELPPNMRKPDHCPRERHPLLLEVLLDGTPLFATTVTASGLHSDGKASIYKRFAVGAGEHQVSVHMNDAGGEQAGEIATTRTLRLVPGENVVIYFDSDNREFKFDQVLQ